MSLGFSRWISLPRSQTPEEWIVNAETSLSPTLHWQSFRSRHCFPHFIPRADYIFPHVLPKWKKVSCSSRTRGIRKDPNRLWFSFRITAVLRASHSALFSWILSAHQIRTIERDVRRAHDRESVRTRVNLKVAITMAQAARLLLPIV